MKKALLSIAAVLMFAEGQAQITLNQASFPNAVVGTIDTFAYISSGHDTTFGNPRVNYLWNLTGLFYTSQRRWINHVPATGYTYANRVLDTLNPGSFIITNQFTLLADYLTNLGTTGIIQHGIKVPAMSYSISMFTGGVVTDSIKINAQSALYYNATIGNQLLPRTIIPFPATYNQVTPVSWNNHVIDTVHGRMTYAAENLIDTPFHKKTELIDQKSILGWGKMRLRKPTGYTPQFSDTFQVLQVRCSTQLKDFYYVGNGNSISNIILNQMSVGGQGITRVTYYDEYYRAGFVEPIMTVRFTDANYTNSTTNKADVHLRGLSPSDVAILTSMSNINVYPNPVKGGIVNVDINGTQGSWNYSLLNTNGQVLKTGVVAEGKNTVTLPSNMPAGTYFMSLENGAEKIAKTLVIAE